MTERTSAIAAAVVVLIVAALVYANALANGFAYDDVFIVQHNARVHDLSDLRSIWLRPYWPVFGVELGLWRPFVTFAYAVQWAIVGEQAWFFHLVNILLHGCVSVLSFVLLKLLTRSTAAAFIGALVFAVHPVHTEVVANVVGQAELIAAATTLAACIVHVARPAGAAVGWYRRIAILLLFLAGVLAKESAIVLPALLVALDAAQRRFAFDAAGIRRYAAAMAMLVFILAAASILYFSFRVGVLGSIGGVDAAPSLGFLREEHRVLVAFRGWIEYVRLLIYPVELSSDYSPGVILPVEGWTPMVTLGAFLLAGTAILAVLTPLSPQTGLPAAWLLITMLPTSNLLIPIGVVVAERLLYTPSFALSLAIAFGFDALTRAAGTARSRHLAYAAVAAVVVLMSARTWIRNPDWKSTLAVQSALARDHPESYRSQWHNASRAYVAGQREIGEGYMRLAHRIWPNDPQLLNEIGFTHLGHARFDSAAAYAERSREITPWVARTHIILAQAYIGMGRFQDALDVTAEAHRLGATADVTQPLRAQAYDGIGELDMAIAAWSATTRTSGEFWNYWARLARSYARAGDQASALNAADSAHAHVQASDSEAKALLQQLREEIAAGCYTDLQAARKGSMCEDPLGQWKLLAPIVVNTAPENAR